MHIFASIGLLHDNRHACFHIVMIFSHVALPGGGGGGGGGGANIVIKTIFGSSVLPNSEVTVAKSYLRAT